MEILIFTTVIQLGVILFMYSKIRALKVENKILKEKTNRK